MRHLACWVLLLCASLVVQAEGEVWRYPEKTPPAQGPAAVKLGADSKAAKLSRLEVIVRGPDDAPVPGIGCTVASGGKNKSQQVQAATGADGRIAIEAGGLSDLSLTFAWDGGAKTVIAHLAARGKAWELREARYRRILDGAEEGSCKNLFSLKPVEETGSYKLRFHLPQGLLECEEVTYGTERKVPELARVDAIGKRDVNLGDKNMFSPEDERKMGLEASSQFDQQLERIDDAEIVGYVRSVLERIVAASDSPKMPINLRVVHTDDVNAFVTAGGHVYVFTGLIKMAQNESQLAGVLAHEGSHAVARHVTEGATRNQKALMGASLGSAALGALLGTDGTKQQLIEQGAVGAAQVVTLRYDRRAETEADLIGSQYLWKAGWDPEGIARFFELMEKKSGGGGGGPQWMSTHPPHEKRIENGILWARAFLPTKERYLVDTAEFQAAKAKVLKLPAPKKAKPEAATPAAKGLHQLMLETPTFKGIVQASEQ